MLRYFAVPVFLSLALAGYAAATTKVGGSGKTKVGGSGTTKVTANVSGFTQREQQAGTTVNYYEVSDGTYSKIATPFVATATYTYTKGVIRQAKVGSPVVNLTLEVWSDSAGSPGSINGTGSGTIAASSLGTSEADVTYTGLSASITNTTTYWQVITASAIGNTSDKIRNYVATQGSTGVKVWNGSSWAAYTGGEQMKFTNYSTP